MTDDKVRASGKTAAEEVAQEVIAEADKTMEVELPDEREKSFQTPGFSRFRMNWFGEDATMISSMHEVVDQKLNEHFADAYTIMYEIYDLVRQKLTNPDGSTAKDKYGLELWARNDTGNYIEDWDKLNYRQRERFLFLITTRLFEWEQVAAGAWAEAMMSKAIWEESFAIRFTELPAVSATRPTVDDRTNHARVLSKEDKYFAIFCTYYSRKADALVRNMNLIAQRLKDVHVVNGR
jgi:hypothetical protein